MGSVPPPPSYGQRLLPVEIDKIALDDPDRVLYYTPRNNQPSQGYEVVTTSRFANAVNRVCWWLESEVGTHTTPKTIGYLGQSTSSRLLTRILVLYGTILIFLLLFRRLEVLPCDRSVHESWPQGMISSMMPRLLLSRLTLDGGPPVLATE